jgi:hypothetical protein
MHEILTDCFNLDLPAQFGLLKMAQASIRSAVRDNDVNTSRLQRPVNMMR